MRRASVVMVVVAVAMLVGAFALQRAEEQLAAPSTSQVERFKAQDLGPKPEVKGKKALVTHLPILSINTNGEPIPQTNRDGNLADELPAGTKVDPDCTVEVRAAQGTWNTTQDSPSQTVAGVIRVRGNSSRHFAKKSYLFRATNSSGENEDVELLGMPKASEWVLNGPYLDRTLMRNYLVYAISREVMPYAPRTRYCEVMLNGNYQGVYLLTEAVTRGEGRVEVGQPSKDSSITGWLVRWDRDGKGDTPLDVFCYYTYRAGVSGLDLRYPGKNTVTAERAAYVTNQISQIERELYATGTSDQVDVTAFAQYFVINEFFGNVDAGRFSTYYYKDVREQVTPVVWDFNNACDNYIEYVYDEAGFYMTDAPWFSAMLRDEQFVESVVDQYHALRKTLLSNEFIDGYLDDAQTYLGDAIQRNFERWPVFDLASVKTSSRNYVVNYLHPLDRNYTSYEESVQQLKDWLAARGTWLDNNIESLRQHCHTSKKV